MLTDFIFSETTEEGKVYTTWIELQNISYWSTHIPHSNNILDVTTSSCTWQNKKAHSMSKQSYNFKQELTMHQNEEKMAQTPLQSKQKILRKQSKQRDSSESSKTGKTNLCMKSTYFEVKKPM